MTLAEWFDQKDIAERLAVRGMSGECAKHTAVCFVEAAKLLQQSGVAPTADVVACWAPGRIEVFGKHTDYCGGESILAAVERGFCLLATPRSDGQVAMGDPVAPFQEIKLDPAISPTLGHWTNYPHTVVRRFVKNFPNAHRGATIAFASNLPRSSGMSSSSAFVVGTFLVLAHINNLEEDASYVTTIHNREDIAGYLGTVENGASFGPLVGDRGVGTFGGSEDHTAILCGQPHRLVKYAFCPVRVRCTIELDDDYIFAIASSGVVAEKTGAALAKYNRISAMVRTIVDTWRVVTGRDDQSLAAILASEGGDSAKLHDILADNADPAIVADLAERLAHFKKEMSLIAAVPNAVNATTIDKFGEAAYESHAAANQQLKNQTAETNRLVEIAMDLGAPAASAFGAGFGGSVWALVPNSSIDDFSAAWQSTYRREFPEPAAHSVFFATRPSVPAFAM